MTANCVINELSFAAHSASNLRYRLVRGPVQLAPLIVLDSRTLSWGERTVTFYVLGASHAMSIRLGRRQITEMLSCIGPPVNRRSIAEFGVIGSAAITAVVHDLSVVCKLNQLPLGSAQTVTVTTHQSDNPQYAYMEHEYMNPDLSMPSWTRLRWQLNASSLLLETEHTYPQEGISIQSETTVTVIDTFRQESAHGR